MDNLKGNQDPISMSSTEPDSSKAVTTNVIEKKGNKKSNVKILSDDARNVGSYVLVDVIVPKIKELITSGFKYAIDCIFYGSKGAKPKSGIGTVSYTNYYTGNGYQQQTGYSNPMVTRQNSIYAINEFVFPDRGDAENVLLAMMDTIKKYGSVNVGDFYDFVNKPHSFTDLKYGWRDLSSADIIRVQDGFTIRFPKVMPLE